jgi:uncharacterized protein with NRDE domain
MCLIFLSLNHHPAYKLVVAGNRDEFYKRKTAPAHFWEEHPYVVGGRDREAHGTWMAMNKNGRLGMVTNYRDIRNLKDNAPSRGQLVSDYLISDHPPFEYLKKVQKVAAAYNGFNLLVGSGDELWYLSNYKTDVEQIPPGIHGLSNHVLNTPWPKVTRGLAKFNSVLASQEIKVEEFFSLLYDDEQAEDELLPDTGVGLERERMLSSMFIKSSNYGSRCSTVILVDRDDQVTYAERVYDLATFAHTTQTFRFRIEPTS